MNESDVREWPAGCGVMHERIRRHDWSASPLGELCGWPSCLRAAVDIMLGLPLPAMLLWGRRGVLFYNDAWRTLAGDDHAGRLGNAMADETAHPWVAHMRSLVAILDRAGSDGRTVELASASGPAQRLRFDYATVSDEGGGPAGMLALASGDGGLPSLVRRLRDSEARLNAIVTRAPVGLSEISDQGRFLRVNDALCSMLGRSREELLAAGVADVTHPEDVMRSLEAFGRLLQEREAVSVDKRYLDAEGRVIYARSSLNLLDHGGRRTVLAVTVDLSARRLAEQALAESEARFRALADASPALIWHLDPNGKIDYLNRRYLALTGRSAEDLERNWTSELHPDERDAWLQQLAHARGSRSSVRGRLRMRSADADWRWMETHASPWFGAGGAYAGHVGISIDVTDLVLTQQELAVSNERLKLAIEGSGDGVWDWDIAHDRVICSDRLRQMLGYDAADRLDSVKDWAQRTHPEDRQGAQEALDACMAGRSAAYRHEHRLLCKSGDWKWVLARAIVVARDEHGRALRMTGTVTDISEKRQSEEVIWRHANFDGLTKLPNRRLFRDRLEFSVLKARRNGLPMALLFIDLDRFKEANDLLGHDVGDQLLVEAAHRIARCVRSSDTVARLGGDEFTAILTDLVDLAHVEWIAQKIISALSEPFRLGNEVVYLSASVGITLYPSDAQTPQALIRNADQAMYAAKNGGRNRFSYFTPAMQAQAQTRLRLIADLRGALAGEELQVWYQPVVDLRSGRIAKAEALLRWFHPQMGLVEPQRFIPCAEESGLINDIGEWVFRQAAQHSRRWGERLGQPFQISVNKSPVQFLGRGRDSDWGGHLKDLGLAGSSISVEITEGLLLDASPIIIDRLMQLRGAGIEVAIDDFGTGYSSMAYLRKFQIDYLKIDRSFVQQVATDSGDRAIVRSIIAMAHELGLRVVAEGVENDEQRHALVEAGCDYGQGYLISGALPPEAFEQMLLAR
ncbi:sensor domain-containing protein [Noviherbaspirillum aridicola]|uniref:Diguanylate cyclase n=1 Tax=Noviherbaspirillum aridicola TaxID=2849687 RepID=A0ABQ4Q595_9BURK|nr:EAL domain-containing protein [Noviherbaspirillum aridicola]GIZ52217.1 diguanylate cyclase [Noviherbaspirillum aridicola]